MQSNTTGDSGREKDMPHWTTWRSTVLNRTCQLKRLRSTLAALCLAAGVLAGMIADTAGGQEFRPAGTIVAVGDSLTEGLGVSEEQAYPARLEKLLRSDGYDYRVINAGISGETSSGARSRQPWVLKLKPDIVILETGANDGLRGLDPQLIRENISDMLQQFATRDIVVVLAGMKMLANLGPEYTAAFEEAYDQAAQGYDVIRVPFFLEGVAGDPRLNQPDGIHPTAEGYALIAANLYPFAIKAIERHRRKAASEKAAERTLP